MQKLWDFIKRTIMVTGTTFMFITLFIWVFGSFVAKNNGSSSNIEFVSSTFGIILLVSFLTALIKNVFNFSFIPYLVLRVLIHFVLTIAEVIVFFMLLELSSNGIFLLTVVFAIIYIIIASISLLIINAKKKKNQNNSSYENIIKEAE